MTKPTVRVVGHYEVAETPFSRSYTWHPAYVNLECNCGAQLTLSGASSAPLCSKCGTDHSGVTARSKSEKTGWGTRSLIRGATTPKSRQNNTERTRLLIWKARPGATTTSPRVVRMMNVMFNSSPLWVSKFQRIGATCP